MGRTSAAVRKCGPCGAANGCCPLIGPRSLTGNIRQASGSARSSHAMRLCHLSLGSWLMPSLHLAGAKGRGRMRGGHCARGYASTAMCGAAYRVRKSVAQMCACLPIAITPPPMWQTANGRRTKEKGLMLIRRPVQSMQPVALAWGLHASRGLRHGNRQRVIGGALLNWQRAFLHSWQAALRVSDQAHGRCLRAACNACAWPEAGLVTAY